MEKEILSICLNIVENANMTEEYVIKVAGYGLKTMHQYFTTFLTKPHISKIGEGKAFRSLK